MPQIIISEGARNGCSNRIRSLSRQSTPSWSGFGAWACAAHGRVHGASCIPQPPTPSRRLSRGQSSPPANTAATASKAAAASSAGDGEHSASRPARLSRCIFLRLDSENSSGRLHVGPRSYRAAARPARFRLVSLRWAASRGPIPSAGDSLPLTSTRRNRATRQLVPPMVHARFRRKIRVFVRSRDSLCNRGARRYPTGRAESVIAGARPTSVAIARGCLRPLWAAEVRERPARPTCSGDYSTIRPDGRQGMSATCAEGARQRTSLRADRVVPPLGPDGGRAAGGIIRRRGASLRGASRGYVRALRRVSRLRTAES